MKPSETPSPARSADPRNRGALTVAPAGSRQRGVTLVVSLIFLLLLTIIGVTALSTNSLQEKMAGNMRDKDVAFQAGESALRAGEEGLQAISLAVGNTPPLASATCATGNVCPYTASQATIDAWWNANSTAVPAITGVYAAPRYLIDLQEIDYPPGQRGGGYAPHGKITFYYRITARSFGLTPFAQAMQQETYQIYIINN